MPPFGPYMGRMGVDLGGHTRTNQDTKVLVFCGFYAIFRVILEGRLERVAGIEPA